jgi:hypothetical protein
MTQIILKTTVWKEDTEKIADKGASGGIAVSGSAIGPAYARILIKSSLFKSKTPILNSRVGVYLFLSVVQPLNAKRSHCGNSPERLAVEGIFFHFLLFILQTAH